MITRKQPASAARLVLEWAARRGPAVIFLRIADQAARLILARPLMRYSRITPQLYVGGQYRRRGWPAMQAAGITAVLNLRKEYDDLAHNVVPQHYLYLPTTDNTAPTLEQLQQGVVFIQQVISQGGAVYVHCGVGVGRAPTMAAAYLVSTGKTPAAAWEQIRRVRPFIFPMASQVERVESFAVLIGSQQGS